MCLYGVDRVSYWVGSIFFFSKINSAPHKLMSKLLAARTKALDILAWFDCIFIYC